METREIISIINFSGPFITALFCLLLIIMRYKQRDSYTRTMLLRLLMVYYIAIICVSFTAFSLVYLRSVYIITNLFSMLSILYCMVIIFHIIHLVTAIGKPKPFSFIHYLTPAIVTLIQYLWSYYFLLKTDTTIIYSNSWFLAVSSFKLGVWAIYAIFYSVYSLQKIIRYKKIIINYSADEDRSSLKWLYTVIICTIALIPSTLLHLFLRNESALVSTFSIITNCILQFQLVVLAYNMFTENYVIMYPVGSNAESVNIHLSKIDKESFEQFMREKKPYLNPELRITDLMRELCTNRSYLSGYINKTYSMSFSRYINCCRLRELKLMQNDPKLSSYDHESLIIKAGFRSIRGYQRFTKQEGVNS